MPKMRWLMIWLCFLANAIAYIDRTNIAVATPAIRAELGINAAAMGLVLSAFFWTYAFMQLPAGWFIDRIGVRLALAFAVAWWSLFTAATSVARNVVQFIGLRLMLGAGEAFRQPSFAKTASNWFPPPRGAAWPCSIFNSGSTAGSALSLPLVTWLIVAVGWRGAFLATGGLGLVWALAWWLLYRDPERWREVAPEQVDRLLAEREIPSAAAEQISWFSLFRYRSVWGLMLGLFCLNFAIYFFITWFPSYLLQARGFSLKDHWGRWGALPAIMGVVEQLDRAAKKSDRLLRAGLVADLVAPTRPAWWGEMLMTIFKHRAFLNPLWPSNWACLGLFTLAYFSLSFAGANCWTVVSEIAPTPRHVASIGGIQNCAGNVAEHHPHHFFTGTWLLVLDQRLVPDPAGGGWRAMCVLGALSCYSSCWGRWNRCRRWIEENGEGPRPSPLSGFYAFTQSALTRMAMRMAMATMQGQPSIAVPILPKIAASGTLPRTGNDLQRLGAEDQHHGHHIDAQTALRGVVLCRRWRRAAARWGCDLQDGDKEAGWRRWR